MTDLLTALQSAERGSRELDLAVAQAFQQPWSYIGEPPRQIECDYLTTSIDAALALVARVLPDHMVHLGLEQRLPNREIWAASVLMDQELVFAPTPPLALVTALVRAKEAM